MPLNEKEVAFLQNLKCLLEIHDVRLAEREHYNYKEEYTGSTFYFHSKDIFVEIDKELVYLLEN